MIRDLVTEMCRQVDADRMALTGHSGGGSFLLGFLNACDQLPAELERVVFLDANYSYSDDERHGDKLLEWLQRDAQRRLVVVAYDDREVTYNGQKVVGPRGGTYRATQRMQVRFGRDLVLTEQTLGEFQQTSGLDGQLQLLVHTNPQNKILHTALVGDMNGLLHSLTLGTPQQRERRMLGGQRDYMRWIQPQPAIDPTAVRAKIVSHAPDVRLTLPVRPPGAPTGSQFRDQILRLSRDEREAAIQRQLTLGNVPEFLRKLIPIRVEAMDQAGTRLVATCFVTCDCLAVGSDDDFFRVPMAPGTAAAIADAAGCSLITPRLSDAIWAAAALKLDPKPLTEDREAVATFYAHHELVQEQLRGQPRGQLVAGIKKDIVLTRRLTQRPNRVALYGWHYPHGSPIQPLYVGHVDWYVDYSHGVRLLSDQVLVDGHTLTVSQVLKDPRLCILLSSEGPLDPAALRKAAQW